VIYFYKCLCEHVYGYYDSIRILLSAMLSLIFFPVYIIMFLDCHSLLINTIEILLYVPGKLLGGKFKFCQNVHFMLLQICEFYFLCGT